jgi:SAM-dependent methyltransferase
VANHAKRTAEIDAAFFLPFLNPGMRLLDVGCGPGSITAGLAKCVAPGETIGVDPSSSVIHTATSLRSGLSDGRLTFEVGDIYTSRFSFTFGRCCGMIRHGTIAGADACQGLGFGQTKPWYSWGVSRTVWETKPLNLQGRPIPLRGASRILQRNINSLC